MIFWDSSALVALLVEESESKTRIRQLAADPAMTVWWGTPMECESAIQRRIREKSLKPEGARQARAQLKRLTAAWHEVTPAGGVRQLAVRLVRTHPLRAADALQLAAAISLEQAGLETLKFACSDQRLNEAAEIENLTILVP